MTSPKPQLAYCTATALDLPFLEKLEAAAAAGFTHISMSVPDYHGARDHGLSDDDIEAAIRKSGLALAEVSTISSWLAGEPSALEAEVFHIAKRFGARGCNCTPMETMAPFRGIDAAVAAFTGVCDRAEQHGLRCHIEFVPWSSVGNLLTAWEIVRRADRRNGGIMFDNWHHFRAGGKPEDLLAVPVEKIFAVQLSDAPAVAESSNLFKETFRRLLPGAGEMDVAGNVRALLDIGVDAPLGGEPINPVWNQQPATASAQALYQALVGVISEASKRHPIA